MITPTARLTPGEVSRYAPGLMKAKARNLERKTEMKLKYDGKTIGTITTNRSLTLEECFDALGIDIDEMEDSNTPKWDYELFEMDYED